MFRIARHNEAYHHIPHAQEGIYIKKYMEENYYSEHNCRFPLIKIFYKFNMLCTVQNMLTVFIHALKMEGYM